MTLEEALWQDSERCGGAVCFRGTRIMVSILFDYLVADGVEAFRENYPDVTAEQLQAVLSDSRTTLAHRFEHKIAA